MAPFDAAPLFRTSSPIYPESRPASLRTARIMATASSERLALIDALSDLTRQQEALQKALAAVTLEIGSTKQTIAAIHNDTLSPTSGLPPEIITQIFISLHDSQELVRDRGSDKVLSESNPEVQVLPPIVCSTWPRAEVAVSQVCHRWRDIALGLPSLWNLFWTRPENATNEGIITETKRLKTYIQRSKNCDLELYLEFQSPSHLPGDSVTRHWNLIEEMVGVTVSHAYRWKYFTFSAVNHDRRMASILLPIQQRLAQVSAPKLEKFVVRTSPSPYLRCHLTEGMGWPAQVLLPDAQRQRTLKHLRLDRVGLAFCRPSIQGLAHLVLEYGARADNLPVPTFQMDWPVFINNILRSPQLESLSICDDLLRTTTFPGSPWNWTVHHVKMEKIKHLRLGRCFERNERHSALYFLLRYITAPRLESLTIAGYIMEESPWGLTGPVDWLEGWTTITEISSGNVFPSLKSLCLIDVTVAAKVNIPSSYAAGAAFLRLVEITRSAKNVIATTSLKPLFDGADQHKWMPFREFWPELQDLTLNFTTVQPWESYSTWKAFGTWRRLRVLRIPASQIPSWFAMTVVVQRYRRGCGMPGGEDFVMCGGEPGTLYLGYDYILLNYGIVLEPIASVLPIYRPPDSDITSRNTLEFEAAARPFYSDVADTQRS